MVFRLPKAFSATRPTRTPKLSVSLFTITIVACLISPTLALQVTPNSACASLCMDLPSSDASDPNSSNIYGSGVVCQDVDYGSSATGSKFEGCLNCLQSSSASAASENDQGWYFYNLRYAFNSCIFGTTNATDSFSTPCSSSTVCGPLQNSLGDGMETPSTSSQYSYCTAYDNSFLGSSLDTCRDCLKLNSNAMYLSNFLTALQAGCVQRPPTGMMVGLNSTVFTKNQVTITSPRRSSNGTKHKSLSEGAIIGIAVACGLLLLVLITIILVCLRKRRNARRLNQLRSPLHERFGADNITAPNSGAFSSPQTSPPLKKESVQMTTAPRVRNFSFHRQPERSPEWHGEVPRQSPALSSSPPSYSPPISTTPRDTLPAHHAYIPPEYTPPSRNSTSPMFVPPPFPMQPSQQAPRPVPASHPQRSGSSSREVPAARMPRSNSATREVRSTLPVAPHPSMPRKQSNATSVRSSAAAVARSNSSATTPPAQNLGARRGFAPSPVITDVSTFEAEEQARLARERLYRQGLGGTRAHGPEAKIPERPSPESDTGSDELWPGSY